MIFFSGGFRNAGIVDGGSAGGFPTIGGLGWFGPGGSGGGGTGGSTGGGGWMIVGPFLQAKMFFRSICSKLPVDIWIMTLVSPRDEQSGSQPVS